MPGVSALSRSALSLDDFERLAQRVLPRPLFGYVSGACEDNQSLRANREAFAAYELSPRVLVDVSERSQAVEIFGQHYAAPFGIAPMGIAALTAYRGDVVLAQAAQQARVPAIMSGWSLIPMEEVAQAAPDTWFQAYLSRRQDQADALIDRAERAGFSTLVITVDTPSPANRENNVRVGFSSPLRPSLRLAWDGLVRPRWLAGVFARTLWRHGMPHFENWHGGRGVPMFAKSLDVDIAQRGHLSWQHVAQIRRRWRGRLVLKGILDPRDAALARQHGVDGLIVSNHGGRQLDGAVAPLRVLPAVLEQFQGGPVMLDSGVRRGTDVLKALALGAACVFVGRPFNYAAAVGGPAGVAHAIGLLQAEVQRNMAMMGLTRLDQLSPDSLVRVR
jgi:L-lactate dehydrogenase (cytochrome)